MEMLDHRGLLERFSAGRSAPPFANFAMFQLNLHAIPFGHPYGVVIPQSDVEQVLEARARELGAEILRGHEMTGVHQEEDLVRVGIVGPNGAYEECCHYLVGCDGGHSAVRTLSGISFPGLAPTIVARFADVTIGEEAKPLLKHAVPELHNQTFGIARTETGNFAIVPLGSGITRVAAVEWDQAQVDRDVPMTLDELQQALLRVIGTELPMSEPRWMTRATDTSRQAERYIMWNQGNLASIFRWLFAAAPPTKMHSISESEGRHQPSPLQSADSRAARAMRVSVAMIIPWLCPALASAS
jgi:2-polyprenyl-6-methoxyphenol hydroxylase-like FAD-dependent oxidoreductase